MVAYNMSSLLHTKYDLLALLQNTIYLLYTLNSLTADLPKFSLSTSTICSPRTYNYVVCNAKSPPTLAQEVPQHKHDVRRRLVSDGWCDYFIRSTTCFLFRNKIVEFSFSGTNVAIIISIQSAMLTLQVLTRQCTKSLFRTSTSFQFDSHQYRFLFRTFQ